MVQWIGLCTSDAGTWVPPLVRDLGSHVLCDGAKKKKAQNHLFGVRLASRWERLGGRDGRLVTYDRIGKYTKK